MENENIEVLELSAKVHNALSRLFRSKNKSQTIGELIKLSFDELNGIRNLGDVGFKELLDKVHYVGLNFDFESLIDGDDYISMTRVNELELDKTKLLQLKQQRQIDEIREKQALLKSKFNNDAMNSNKYTGELSLEILSLSNRSLNAVTKFGRIETIDELLNKNTKELKSIRNLGTESYNDILKSLHILGLKLSDEDINEEDIDITNEYFSNADSLNEEYEKSKDLSKKRSELQLKGRILRKLISISTISNKKTY